MASFVTDSEIASYQSAMSQLHDTFKRPIIIYQSPSQTIVTTNVNHNFLYPSSEDNISQNTDVANTVVSGLYYARIHYWHEQKTDFLKNNNNDSSEQINVRRKEGSVKLVLDENAYNIIKTCRRVTFDSGVYQVESDPRPHGVIGVQFWNLYLKPLN